MPGTFSEDYSSSSVKVFLGGTCNNSQWREQLKNNLAASVGWFDPVVSDWQPEDQAIEVQVREQSDYVLYVISPLMTGVYSIAEAIDDSHRKPSKIIFTVLDSEMGATWPAAQRKSLSAVEAMLKRNGAVVLDNLNQVADFLNTEGIHRVTTPSMEDKKWSALVTKKEKWHPPEGLFKKSAKTIADTLIRASKDKRQAISRLQFYINRAGHNLTAGDLNRLEEAKKLIQKHYDKLRVSQEDDASPVRVVVIQGNPKYIRGNPKAKEFYLDIKAYIEKQGGIVSFDPGEPMTIPKVKADIWIGHSRGCDRLRFAPDGVKTIALGSSDKNAINDPEDNAITFTGKPDPNWKPNDHHFTLTDAMKKAIDTAIHEVNASMVVSQECDRPPSARW